MSRILHCTHPIAGFGPVSLQVVKDPCRDLSVEQTYSKFIKLDH